MAKEEELGEDFSYLIRIANTDIDGLSTQDRTHVHSCRKSNGHSNLPSSKHSPSTLAGSLSKEQQEALRETLETYNQNVPEWMLNGKEIQKVEMNYTSLVKIYAWFLMMMVFRLRSIKSYRGIRHAGGHKVRGQRGRSNGRFGLVLGVQRKK